MSAHVRTAAALALAFAAAAACAQDPVRPLWSGQAVHYVADCGHRALPSQRDVGAWTGQSNFSQVYATRQRLMAEIGRACRQPGVGRVYLVVGPDAGRAHPRPIAIAEANR